MSGAGAAEVRATLAALAWPRPGLPGRTPPKRAEALAYVERQLAHPEGGYASFELAMALHARVAALDDAARADLAARWYDAIDQTALSSPTHKARQSAAVAARLFPDDPRFWDLIAALPAASWAGYVGLLLAAAPDDAALAPLIDAATPGVVWSRVDAAGLILRGGDRAVALLKPVFLAALKTNPAHGKVDWSAPDLQDRLADGLTIFCALGHADVIHTVVKQAELARSHDALRAAVRHAPDAVLRACLAEGVSRRGVPRDLAIFLRRGGVVVDEAAMSTLDARLAVAGVAAGDDLPAVLRSPPWQGRAVTPPPRRPGLVAPGADVIADVVDGDAAAARPTITAAAARRILLRRGTLGALVEAWAPRWAEGDTTGLAGALDEVEAALSTSWAQQLSGVVVAVDDGFLRPLWRAFHPTAWELDDAGARVVVARLGVEAVDGLLARGGLDVALPPPTHGRTGAMAARTSLKVGQSLVALAPVGSVRITPLAVRGLQRRPTRRAATTWLLRHPRHAAAGLIPLALGEGPDAAGAREGIRVLVAAGHADLLRAAARHHGDEVVGDVETLLSADPLALAKAPRRPAWLAVERLPPLVTTAGLAVDVDAARVAVGILAAGAVDAPYAALPALQEAVTPSSLADVAVGLWRQWWLAGSPSADAAAVGAGLIWAGDADAATALASLTIAYGRDGMTARAKQGIELLEGMAGRGDDDAPLIALSRVERSSKGAVKAAATQGIARLALARGLSADALADRLVPDLGLDADGTMGLDLGGGRRVRLTFDAMLRPRYRLADGSVVERLPPVGKGDKVAHAAAKATAKAVAKEAADVGRRALVRLEGLMREARRIEHDVARRCFFAHPLITHVARRLVWLDLQVDDAGEEILGAFRVAEDGTYADDHDDAVVLRGTHVGLLHPAAGAVDDAVLERFRVVFRDYELIQPFAQLDRPVFTLADSEQGDVLRRFAGAVVETGRIFTLEARGWLRASSGTATRRLGDGEATLTFSPGISGGPDAARGGQTLGALTFDGEGGLGGLPAVARSELLYDLVRLLPPPT